MSALPVMTKPLPEDVTQLLLDWSNGDPAALNQLTPLAHAEVRRLAVSHLRRERFDHTLQDTELVTKLKRLADHADLTESRLGFACRGNILKGEERCRTRTVIERYCKR